MYHDSTHSHGTPASIGRRGTLSRLLFTGCRLWLIACGLEIHCWGQTPAADSPPNLTVVPLPQPALAEWRLSDFYKKVVMLGDFPVVASEQVHDAALLEAATIVNQMLRERPDILRQLAANRIRLTVMATHERTCQVPEHHDLTPREYWNIRARGLGATRARPSVSCAEENVLNLDGDPYDGESILIHEFAHAIHLMALSDLEPTFQQRLEESYQAALKIEKWVGTYAGSNVEEYWAEGVQSWFDCNRAADRQHNHVNTRAELWEYDPALAQLCKHVFGDNEYRYLPSRDPARQDPHLQGLARHELPKFQWSPEEWEEIRRQGRDRR